jgi:hypothetical protein
MDHHRIVDALRSTLTSQICGRCDYDWFRYRIPLNPNDSRLAPPRPLIIPEVYMKK